MIDPTFVDEISGLRELFSLVPEEYSFHDAELESAEWSLLDCELVVRYFCCYGLDRQIYVTFYLKPEMNDFTIELSPHNPYTYGIEISRVSRSCRSTISLLTAAALKWTALISELRQNSLNR